METILIKCPHCNEEMQAPTGRETIICMFCGKSIDLTSMMTTVSKENYDAEKCYNNLNKVIEGADKAFENYRVYVRGFKRDTYQDLFEDYKANNYGFFTAIKNCLLSASEDSLDGVYHQISRALIMSHQRELDQLKRKSDKSTIQMDKNMFMVVFVLPSIKEIRSQKADILADEICKEWGKAFKDSNILASDYDSISDGFKRKLCYVTTAVCRNLHLEENCEALRLIKEFRDGYLASTKDGGAMIDAYYDIAPTLVKRIEKDASAEEKYVWLWNQYIQPCVEFIKAGENEACCEKYCEMVNALKDEYVRSR
ncbi:MAG: hypothetical protein E7299_10565 [Lachnospiraceae bacterium]|nr:hypothetical protein [Lachnospiraceae bacterium]